MNRFFKFSNFCFVLFVAFFFLQGFASAAGEWNLSDQGEWGITDKGVTIWNASEQDNLTFTWSGGKDGDGYASGKGVLLWLLDNKPVAKYDGYMQRGKRNGKGIFWPRASAMSYEGDWVDNKLSGKVVVNYGNGQRYTGDFANNLQNGKGVYTYANGDRFECTFLNGKANGKGFYTWGNGTRSKAPSSTAFQSAKASLRALTAQATKGTGSKAT